MEDLAANSRQFSTALLQKQMKASSQVLILMTQTLNFVQLQGVQCGSELLFPYTHLVEVSFSGNTLKVCIHCAFCVHVSSHFNSCNKRPIFFLKLGSGVILVINQLDAQNFCFTISLFHVSTCVEHHLLIIRRSVK